MNRLILLLIPFLIACCQPPAGVSNSADQTITSSTTLTDSTDLQIAVDGARKYLFKVYAPIHLNGIVSGYKVGLACTVSPTSVVYTSDVRNGVAGTLVTSVVATALGSINGALATIGDHTVIMEGIIETGTANGMFKVQFAQNTSDTGAIILKRGATIQIQEVR